MKIEQKTGKNNDVRCGGCQKKLRKNGNLSIKCPQCGSLNLYQEVPWMNPGQILRWIGYKGRNCIVVCL